MSTFLENALQLDELSSFLKFWKFYHKNIFFLRRHSELLTCACKYLIKEDVFLVKNHPYAPSSDTEFRTSGHSRHWNDLCGWAPWVWACLYLQCLFLSPDLLNALPQILKICSFFKKVTFFLSSKLTWHEYFRKQCTLSWWAFKNIKVL